MAKLQCELKGNFSMILGHIENAVLNGSQSATKEDSSEFNIDNCRCAVRVYERYSFLGGNRVSMNITLLQVGDRIKLSAITAGGSQAMWYKMNTIGEEKFLDTIRETVEKYKA